MNNKLGKTLLALFGTFLLTANAQQWQRQYDVVDTKNNTVVAVATVNGGLLNRPVTDVHLAVRPTATLGRQWVSDLYFNVNTPTKVGVTPTRYGKFVFPKVSWTLVYNQSTQVDFYFSRANNDSARFNVGDVLNCWVRLDVPATPTTFSGFTADVRGGNGNGLLRTN